MSSLVHYCFLPCACYLSPLTLLSHLSHSTRMHLQMVLRLKTSHVGAFHQCAPQEDYNDHHEGDTDAEIVMEGPPVATLGPSLCQMMRRIQRR
jgi:hypothetical protein